jgi:RsiW-degrading membrane proteinase PrsW (M82 family)
VLLVLLASALAGLVARPLMESHMAPLELARQLTRSGRYAEAEREYIAIGKQRPVSLPALIELVEVHGRRQLLALHRMKDAGAPPALGGNSEADVAAVVLADDLPPEVALLAGWWSRVMRGEAVPADRAPVVAAADARPPAPWANHLLGREAQLDDRDDDAADRFAREASWFDDRGVDADAACAVWIGAGDWEHLERALSDPRFARQVRPEVRLQEAIRRHDWPSAARWFLPAQYGDATPGILVLALVSGLVWFTLCIQMGLVDQRPRFRVPLYLAAFVLGVASTYVTMALGLLEHAYGFDEKGQPLADAIYFVVGVGLREELSKVLLLLPLVPIILRWGRRREALACGALVGLGFAVEENIGYFHMGLSTALARFLTANFLHVSTTGIAAVAIDDAVRGREAQEGDLSRALMTVVAAHGLYDFFLSSAPVAGGSFFSMVVFIFLARRFVGALRDLPGREKPLLRSFCVGLAVVAGATFIYASALVGPGAAAMALAGGALGLALVAMVFVQELRHL